ncbi:MAG: hypothetical protein PHY34_01375 [Patescibacteria group bacterium]|nr:hypothetical protein [Patescibacteria group bacterium]MDD5715129.1 hypothetical protein [Patescibacteria group bacterium]
MRIKILIFFKIIIWCLPVILIIYILTQYFVPSGLLEIHYHVEKESKVVKNFAQKESDRIIGTENKSGNKDYFQLITTSPVYFNVIVPRPFSKAEVSLVYQNPDNQPKIQLGVKQPNSAYSYVDMAFWQPILENLPEYWSKIEENNIILWQKDNEYKTEKLSRDLIFSQKKNELDIWKEEELNSLDEKYKSNRIIQNQNISSSYDSEKQVILTKYNNELKTITGEAKIQREVKGQFSHIQDFLDHLPELTGVVQYNYNLSAFLEMPGYKKSTKPIIIDKSIRGSHEIYTYIGKDEDLNFIFTIQDINRHVGEDPFHVQVFNSSNKKISDVIAPDDGETEATGKVYPQRRHQLLLDNLPMGVYRLVIDLTDDDVFIKQIETTQNLIMFKKNIYPTDNPEYSEILGEKQLTPTTIYTNSNKIKIKTSHEKGIQTLRVGSEKVFIDQVHVPQEINLSPGMTTIYSPRNDIIISGDGYFAFSPDQFFNPDFFVTEDLMKVNDIDNFNFIIADYLHAQSNDGWLTAKATIEVPDLYYSQKNGQTMASFIFSLPGLPENNRMLKIKEVDIRFQKPPVTINSFLQKVKSYISNMINK